jgi:hypothetical protein
MLTFCPKITVDASISGLQDTSLQRHCPRYDSGQQADSLRLPAKILPVVRLISRIIDVSETCLGVRSTLDNLEGVKYPVDL